MTAALFLAVVLTCAGDPEPATIHAAPPPPPAAVGKAEAGTLATLEPDADRPRPRTQPKRQILLELLVTALQIVINR